MTFRRYLSSNAVLESARARWGTVLAEWSCTEGATVHLRRSDEIAFYHLGHRALSIRGAGAPAPVIEAWQGQPVVDAEPTTLRQALAQAGASIEEHRAGSGTEGAERAAQGRHLQRLFDPAAEFWLLDEQIQVPRDALSGDLDDPQPDALLLHRPTGDLWLLELKLATSPDLDGPVLDQLSRTLALPGAIRNGHESFVAHYAEVLRQRAALGLVPGPAPAPSGRIVGAILALGDRAEALARVACWEGPTPRGGLFSALSERDALRADAFVGCEEARARALASADRAPYAPRKSRWTAFALREDAEQHRWRDACPQVDQLGRHHAVLNAYLDAHDAPRHKELEHLRSSQAACLQVFAPILQGVPAAARGLLAVLNERVFGRIGFLATEVEACHFEVPHQGRCWDGPGGATPPPSSCEFAGDLDDLVGEKTAFTTRLDAYLELTGVQDGRELRLGLGCEFKYTEAEFSTCGAFASRSATPEEKASCLNGRERPRTCRLRRSGRKYLDARELGCWMGRDVLEDPGPCPFLGGLNQLLRGAYLTDAFARRRGCAGACFVVIHDERNDVLLTPDRAIPGAPRRPAPSEHLAELLTPERRSRFGVVPVQALVAAYRTACGSEPPEWLGELTRRYRWGPCTTNEGAAGGMPAAPMLLDTRPRSGPYHQ